jgi:signal transduction histidine kinase/CheY-like chemotaxis protein
MRGIRSWITGLGLWPKMALGISLAFLALFLVLVFLVAQGVRDGTSRVREQRLLIAKITAGQIDSFLDQAILNLEQSIERAVPESGPLELPDLVPMTQDENQLSIFSPGLVLLDNEGRSVSSRPPGLFPAGTDLSGLDHIYQALEQGRVSVSDPFQHPLTGQQVFAVTVPVRENGHSIGLLSGFISLANNRMAEPLFEATAISESEHAELVDRDGRVVFSTLDLPSLSPAENASFFREAMAGGVPVVDTVPFELSLPGESAGHLHVIAIVPLTSAPWGVAIGDDAADLFAGVQRLQWGLVALGIAALVAVWSVTLIGMRTLIRPVQRLTRAAGQIAEGNLDVPLQVTTGGEIGLMSTALDRMRDQLLAQIRELAEWSDTLEERVTKQTEDLRQQQALTHQLLRQVMDAQETERTRLARELHDEVGQALTAVELSLGYLANAVSPEDQEVRRRLAQSRALTEQTAADLRAIMAALRPGTLDQLGLVPALEWIGSHTLRQADISVSIEAHGLDRRLPDELETVLFRIAQEAMSNVLRHSQATKLEIDLSAGPEEVRLTLKDNGRGFTNGQMKASGDATLNIGIAGMHERAALAGGELAIESMPGKGTEVRVTLPLRSQEEKGEMMTDQRIRLIVVDDHAIMREGLVRLLADEKDLQIVGLASSGRQAVELALRDSADVILLDVVMEDMTGLEAAREILAVQPEQKIIILTMYEEEAFLREALQAGAKGYFLKGSNSEELIDTIRLVYQGGTYLAPKMASRLGK